MTLVEKHGLHRHNVVHKRTSGLQNITTGSISVLADLQACILTTDKTGAIGFLLSTSFFSKIGYCLLAWWHHCNVLTWSCYSFAKTPWQQHNVSLWFFYKIGSSSLLVSSQPLLLAGLQVCHVLFISENTVGIAAAKVWQHLSTSFCDTQLTKPFKRVSMFFLKYLPASTELRKISKDCLRS